MVQEAGVRDALSIMAEIARAGLTPDQQRAELVAYLAAGCKPAADWRIGTEHEKFGYTLEDHLPLPYGGRRSIRATRRCARTRCATSAGTVHC